MTNFFPFVTAASPLFAFHFSPSFHHSSSSHNSSRRRRSCWLTHVAAVLPSAIANPISPSGWFNLFKYFIFHFIKEDEQQQQRNLVISLNAASKTKNAARRPRRTDEKRRNCNIMKRIVWLWTVSQQGVQFDESSTQFPVAATPPSELPEISLQKTQKNNDAKAIFFTFSATLNLTWGTN